MKIIIKCIYTIRSAVHPERIYIGSARDFQGRVWRHKRELVLNKHRNKKLQNHFNKYGLADISVEILETVKNESELMNREQYYLDLYNPWFNVNKCASSFLGMKHSEETKRKIGDRHKGRIYSKETIQKMRDSRIGKKWSEDSRIKMSISRKGRKLSGIALENVRNATQRPDVIEKKRLASIGRVHSEETKKKISEGNKRRIYSEETKRKMSLSKMGNNYRLKGINNKLNKAA